MMKTNKLREILRAGSPSIATRLSSRWPLITEMVGWAGAYDYVEYLAEYSPIQLEDFENLVRACELYGLASIVKVDYQNHAYFAQKALASGMQGVLFTDCKTPAEIEECIYVTMPDTPEYGGRFGYPSYRWIGYEPYKPQMDYAKMAADSVRLFMIEKKETVDRIEEIVRIPGVDMIQFGPSDFSMNCGHNLSDWTAERREAEETCIRVALEHGVQPRCEINSPKEAEYYMNLGVRHFCLGDQVKILRNWWKDNGTELREMIG